MSSLTGHRRITSQAISELQKSCSKHALGGNLESANLPSFVVQRDILDVISLGHWGNYGQSHHFMRRFDGQSPTQAYKENVEWVRSSAVSAAEKLASRIRLYLLGKQASLGIAPHAAKRSCNLPTLGSGTHLMAQGRQVLGGEFHPTGNGGVVRERVNWQVLGNAIHAIQDSFSDGHVIRGVSIDEKNPGPIEHIKQYAGKEKDKHKHYDSLWFDEDNKKFTIAGKQAVNATKDLLTIIIITAQISASGNDSVSIENRWERFKRVWLVISPSLSAERDFAYDFIIKHQKGIRFGNRNLKTIKMDEEKMAKNLIVEVGTNMRKVHDVFERLDSHYNADSDEVAKFYVNRVKKTGNAIEAALKENKSLVNLLIKVMDEGYTDDDEAAAIQYLKSL